MDLGFETIGNATLICHDRVPVLATDPWLDGSPYFGSWALSHEIPDEQREHIRRCPYVWISHGHPDHLSAESLRGLDGTRTILLADHVGSRLAEALRADGYTVSVLPDREWVPLSDRIRVQSIADFNQDSILLVDLGGRLVVNLNDAWENGWRGDVRKVAASFDVTFLMRISGFGDADMINFFDEEGRSIAPRAALRNPVGADIAKSMKRLNTRYFIPFSSMHQYQRRDSVWANQYTTSLADYGEGFEGPGEILPAFVRYDCVADEVSAIDPVPVEAVVREPSEFGDDWSDRLEPDDVALVSRYFRSIEHLGRHFRYVNVRVGGVDHRIELATKGPDSGITFEVPRSSLMKAISFEVFDDLLIGNFMKTTLHGAAVDKSLYPDFTPYVGKYADNGRARTETELRRYFREYRRRSPYEYFRSRIEQRALLAVRPLVPDESRLYRSLRAAFHSTTRA
jgi:L-ascorbate metabolism protein UlaG (beta-lactamase superfamily)